MKRQAQERVKKEKEALKKAEKLAAQTLAVKESQRKAAEACKVKGQHLTKVNMDTLSAEDLTKLGEKLREAIEMKKQIEKEERREVENKVGHKKQVINGRIMKRVRIVVAHMNPIDGKGKVELERAEKEMSKLLNILV